MHENALYPPLTLDQAERVKNGKKQGQNIHKTGKKVEGKGMPKRLVSKPKKGVGQGQFQQVPPQRNRVIPKREKRVDPKMGKWGEENKWENWELDPNTSIFLELPIQFAAGPRKSRKIPKISRKLSQRKMA